VLGVNATYVFDYPDGRLDERDFRSQVVEDLEELRSELKPDLVFFHSQHDRHQDHKAVHEYATIAMRNGPSKFEMCSPSTERAAFRPHVYFTTDSIELAVRAAAAVRCFSSQRDIVDPYAILSEYVVAGRERASKQHHHEPPPVDQLARQDPLGLDPGAYRTLATMFPMGTVFAQRFEPNGVYFDHR
jgi:LmbE family N-acetylglucosaminyl deacetylase